MKRVLVVLGTRPEAIKLAPLVHALKARPGFEVKLCSTGQHREMLAQTLDLFAITPDHDLALMRPDQDLGAFTAAALAGLSPLLAELRPDLLVVQGDTTTAMAGALAAFYRDVPVAHVEAGLRTGNPRAPFPEECNRQIVSRLARWHFAPTERNRRNLLAEGIAAEAVSVTGNTVIDALLWMRERLREPERDAAVAGALASELGFDPRGRRFLLVTGHRRENFGAGFRGICEGLAAIARRHPEVAIVYPLHLNPQVREPVRASLSGLPNLHLIAPQPYDRFVCLLDRCHLVLTDSGGIQEEAPSLGKPVLVMREATERQEAVEAGTLRLVGTDPQHLAAEAGQLLQDAEAHAAMARAQNPYGDGRAAERIVGVLERVATQGGGAGSLGGGGAGDG